MHYQKLILQVLLLLVELLRHLFSNWCHLFQQGILLVICAVGYKSTCDYIHSSLGEVRLHEHQNLVRDRLRQVLHICCQTPGGFLQTIH
jgi:hypothetical protein